jgi:hypothetical protein
MYSKKTKKLFFDRYLYKVAVRTPLALHFRGNDLESTRRKIDAIRNKMTHHNETETYVGHSWNRTRVSLDTVNRDLATIVLLESQEDCVIRVESTTLSVYSNDESVVDTMTDIYNKWDVYEVSRPENDKIKDFLLANPKAILREEFSHKYKVTVNPLDDSSAFKQWAKNLPKIKVMRNDYRLGGYFYVADLKTLSMCRLFLSDKIRRVDELHAFEEI